VARIDVPDIAARHYRGIFRYLSALTGSRDLAEDLTQEVFLQVARAARNGHSVEHERGWVFAIARRVVAGEARRRKRDVDTCSDVEPALAGTQDLAAQLTSALAALGPDDRDVLLLREHAGLTYDEIAAACGCSVESVRCRLHRTRAALRRLLSV
jgi:RNA polymerase sigma-70 factor (ECF subfamily)